MRALSRAALTASLALPLVLALGAPASAAGIGNCPGGEPTCLYVSGSYPVTNPVVIPGRTIAPTYVAGPRVCNATGTDCISTSFAVPGGSIDSNGNTIGTLNVPGIGVGISSTGVMTLYVTTLPTFTPSGSAVGVTATVTVPEFLVRVDRPGTGYECGPNSNTTVGVLTISHTGCSTTYTVAF